MRLEAQPPRAGDQEQGPWAAPLREDPKRVDEDERTFLRADAPDVEEDDQVVGYPDGRPRPRAVGFGEAVKVHPVGDDVRPGPRGGHGLHELPEDEPGAADDAVGPGDGPGVRGG